MSVTLALPEQTDVAYFQRGILGKDVEIVDNSDGTALVKGIKIFRTGKLRDSRGNEFEWEPDHLAAMVENFQLLRDELPDIPTRAGHSRHPNNLVGYLADVRTDGKFLYADLELTEPDAVGRVKRKTYRGRSAEIGMYQSAQHDTCWPVVMGLAFVDIPAVTGLYESEVGGRQYTIISEEPVPTQPTNQTHEFRLNGSPTSDYAAVQAHISALETKPPAKFMLNGAETTDHAAVQTHINALETAARESRESSRKNFVRSLVDKNLILATQAEHFNALVVTMTDDGFGLFEKGFEGMVAPPLLGAHGGTRDGAPPVPPGSEDPRQARIHELEAIVQQHQLSGIPEEQYREFSSYKELQSLKTGK